MVMNGEKEIQQFCSLEIIYETWLIMFGGSTLQLSSRSFRESQPFRVVSSTVLLLTRGVMNYTMLLVIRKLKFINSYLKRVQGTSEAAAPNA